MNRIHHKFLTNAQRYKNPKKHTNQNGETPIYLRITYNRKKRHIPTGIYVKPISWDAKRQRVKKHKFETELNYRLSELEKRVGDYKMKVLNEQMPFDFVLLTAFVTGSGKRNDAHVFFEKEFGAYKGQPSTRQKHRIALDYLKGYSATLPFGKIDYTFIKNFYDWLLERPNKIHTGKTLSQNYVNNILSSLQYYIGEAIKKKLIASDPFKKFKKTSIATQTPHLTAYELELIENMEVDRLKQVIESSKSINFSLDAAMESYNVFLFACYTGLRFQDLFYLIRSNFRNTSNGVVMQLVPKKTRGKAITVKINISNEFEGRALKIVKPYLEGKKLNDFVFGPRNPETHNSEFNKHLKAIQKACGVALDGSKSLSAHVARHTCAMILLKEYKLRLVEIKTYLGHSDITMTQRYANTVYRAVDEK